MKNVLRPFRRGARHGSSFPLSRREKNRGKENRADRAEERKGQEEKRGGGMLGGYDERHRQNVAVLS